MFLALVRFAPISQMPSSQGPEPEKMPGGGAVAVQEAAPERYSPGRKHPSACYCMVYITRAVKNKYLKSGNRYFQ